MSTSTSGDAAAVAKFEEGLVGKREVDPGEPEDRAKALTIVLDCLRREEEGSVSF
jgi:hypothetical protein